MSRPLVFRLVTPDWTGVWETVDSLRLQAVELEGGCSAARERAVSLIDACLGELRELWEAHSEVLADTDPRCVMERSAFVLACETVVDESGRWTNSDEGALVVRYADSTSSEEPMWFSRDALFALASRIEMEAAAR